MPRLADVVAALDVRYEPAWAEPWDTIGLTCGDPDSDVGRILFAIDPVEAVVDEAIASGAQLLVTHHPLYLGGTSSVAATTAKGRLVHRLITHGIGLFTAHTNADRANPGVNDALAVTLCLDELQVLNPMVEPSLDKITVFVPRGDVDRVIDAMAAAGAGEIGDYSRCAYTVDGVGTFVPGADASPAIGTRGQVERVDETRVEMVAPALDRDRVVAALLAAHPYEEPAYDVIPLAPRRTNRGLGRIGTLATATTLADFTRAVATALPATPWGVRAAGDPDRVVRTVAVCGGSGGDQAALAAVCGADVLVTADLKHHATSEAVADLGIGMIDAGHWATEQPWLAWAAAVLTEDLRAAGTTVDAMVSMIVTDPWGLHAASRSTEPLPE